MPLNNKTILLTGGTGSFGQKFAETVLTAYKPKALRIFSRGEFLQYEMAQKFKSHKALLRFFIGDVRDRQRLHRAMSGVDIVVHAAALKQIVTAEYNPIEAVKTNIQGTVNVINAALDNEVEKAILISTDKAANPANLYGATKLAAEKIFIQSNAYTGRGKTRFAAVRYGNVVGSRGSVIPLFFEQKNNGGHLTITDEKMTRFWITLEQGVAFVIESLKKMHGGEIFVPKIPSIKTISLAQTIAPDATIKVIGIRPGEKLHEILITPEEARHTIEFKHYFIIEPVLPFWPYTNHTGGKKVKENFYYASNNNLQKLTPKEISALVKKNV